MEKGLCKRCCDPFQNEEDDDAFETGLCYRCFENSLEEFEERRRQLIALTNEY